MIRVVRSAGAAMTTCCKLCRVGGLLSPERDLARQND